MSYSKAELSTLKAKKGENLYGYLAFKRRGKVVPAKKGRGSVYNRASFKKWEE